MSIFDSSRLNSLREKAELADLEILTLKPSELTKLNPASLTVGQIITLADVIDAMDTVSTKAATLRTTDTTDVYAPPSRAERRSGGDKAKAVQDMISILTGKIPDDFPVPTVGGPVKYADIPKDEQGNVPDSWLDENCTCTDHEQKRIDADKADGAGLYL